MAARWVCDECAYEQKTPFATCPECASDPTPQPTALSAAERDDWFCEVCGEENTTLRARVEELEPRAAASDQEKAVSDQLRGYLDERNAELAEARADSQRRMCSLTEAQAEAQRMRQKRDTLAEKVGVLREALCRSADVLGFAEYSDAAGAALEALLATAHGEPTSEESDDGL